MTLLQRISRNVKNIVLLFPRAGSRRRGCNLVFVALFFFTLTVYMSERKNERVDDIRSGHQQVYRKRDLAGAKANNANETTGDIHNKQPITRSKKSKKSTEITRNLTPVAIEKSIKSSSLSSASSVPWSDSPEKFLSAIPKDLKNCTKRSPKLVGDMHSNPNITPSMEEVIQHVGPDVLHGGCFAPSKCKALQKVAIIIPFKDRDAHLKTLLYHLHPMLMRQRLHYCIYVAEQYDNGQFNKANVMNAAFEEALKLDDYNCIVFHDVDMIPENDRNFYMCANNPRHLSPAIDKFQYKPHYGTEFGGVTGITPKQYRIANGHSNRFWGWGGEDNDMEFRIQHRNMSIIPSSMKVGRYMMIPHLHPWKFSPNKFPYKLNNTRKSRARVDGLSDLQYHMVNTLRYPLYTKLLIDIRKVKMTKLTLYVDGRPAMDIDLTPDAIDPAKCRWETYENMTLEKHNRIDDSDHAYTSLNVAQRVCETMNGLCGGIVKETGGLNYTLQKKGPPKHSDLELARLLLGKDKIKLQGALGNDLRRAWVKLRKAAASGDFKLRKDGARGLRSDHRDALLGQETEPAMDLQAVLKRNTTAYVKYCPGFFGSYKRVPFAMKQNTGDDVMKWLNEVEGKRFTHFFAYKITMEILLKPLEYLYYTDDKHFESHLEKGSNHYTFTWPGGDPPDPSKPNATKIFSFRTPDFAIPNTPGSYAVESRIADRLQNPYFQWNWWFEVTTGNKYEDARIRDAYWKKKMTENIIKGKAKQHSAMMKEKAARAKKKQVDFQKKMDELKKNQKPGMPPKMKELVGKIQKNFDKHDPEAVEYDLDPHNPLLQSDVGKIEIDDGVDDVPEVIKSSTSTTTTSRKTTLKVIPVENRRFHIAPKKIDQHG